MPNIREIFDLLKTTFQEWNEDKVPRLAAALAYYTAFSIAPLLIIVIAVAGLILGQEAARGQIVEQIEGQIGRDTAEFIESVIENTNNQDAGIIATVIGVVAVVFGAIGFFGQLQDALNTVWEVTPRPGGGLVQMLRTRLLSFTMVLGIGFLLLVSLIISSLISYVTTFVGGILPQVELLAQVLNFILSFAVTTLLFALIYKVLPDAVIAWGDVWIGAAITALLFTIGKLLLSLYLGYSSVASSYGAAGSLIVLLVWVYYTAQILMFGAEFTQVYARRYGSRIVPAEHAMAVTEAQRAQEGMAVRSGASRPEDQKTERPAPIVVPVPEVTLPLPRQAGDGPLLPTSAPRKAKPLSPMLVGLALYNTLVGGLMLLWALTGTREAARPARSGLRALLSRRRD